MTSIRHRNTWMWLAVAAMAVVSLARAQAAADTATVYTHSVLAFLGGPQNGATASPAGSPQIVKIGSSRRRVYLHDGRTGAWMPVLPVLFVGLIAPLSLISPRSILSMGCTPARPELLKRFQRPPPALL